ncbi:hypothetical protein D9C00_13430 [Lacticaseibacillus paracasei]|nr:hypothetical protein D9C00_10780 [Lacticaseibacillus paracasei]RKW79121.1 hypothetical protein D9C00_13430 [Lacticaseibacillus paracasei]
MAATDFQYHSRLISILFKYPSYFWILRTCLVSFKNYLQEGQYNHLKTAVKGLNATSCICSRCYRNDGSLNVHGVG